MAWAVYACGDDDATSSSVPDSGTASPVADTGAPLVDTGVPAIDAGPTTLALDFEARVGDQVFSCGQTFPSFGTTTATIAPQDLRFFVSNVRLLRVGGGEEVAVTLATNAMQNASVALLDFEDKTGQCEDGTTETNHTIAGTVPAGTYDGIAFTVGVPEALNHVNTATAEAPLLGSDMQWGWTAGFKHMSLGFFPQTTFSDGGKPTAFYTHIGSTGCSGSPQTGDAAVCTRANRPEVRLTGFDPAKSKVVFDLRALYGGSNVDQNQGGPGGCMSGATDPECSPIFDRLGLNDAGGTFASPAAFSVVAK